MQQLSKPIFLLGAWIWLLGGCAPTPVKESAPPVAIAPARPSHDPWLLVDTRTDQLKIMQGDRPVQVFQQVALGSSGAGLKHRRGDNKTPTGVFRVGWVNDRSKFKRFIGLDYPNLDYADRAVRDGRIDSSSYERIRSAVLSGHTPPQDTPLGGQIGIHGIGAGNPSVHEAGIDWTSGCVALDNQQIDALRPWVKVGMRVEIR